MQKIVTTRKYYLAFVALFIFGAVLLFTLDNRGLFSGQSFGIKKDISIIHSGDNEILVGQSRAETVCELLNEQNIKYTVTDKIVPECDAVVATGMMIEVLAQQSATVMADGDKKIVQHYGMETLQEILIRDGIEIGELDIVSLERGARLTDGQEVNITRVTKEEVTETQRILFQEIIEKSDQHNTSFAEITQEGEEGEEEVTYAVTRHDGEEVDREESAREIVKQKKDRIITRGTQAVELQQEAELGAKKLEGQGGLKNQSITLGESHEGQSSWYAHKGCDCAANPWLPKGSRAKVTAVNSGKSVIVTINDRGPFVPGRIIDLDKTAFEKIAPLGAGVIDVIMEEVIE